MDFIGLISSVAPEGIAEFELIKQNFAVKPTTFTGWMDALGFTADSPIRAVAALVEQFHTGPVTADHVAALLGLDPAGILGGLVKIFDAVETAIKAGQIAPPATPGTQPPAPSGSGAAGTSAGGAGGPHGTVLK